MKNNWFDDEQENIKELKGWSDITDDFYEEKTTIKHRDIIERIKNIDDIEESENWKRNVLSDMFEHDYDYIQSKLEMYFPNYGNYNAYELYKYLYVGNSYNNGTIEEFCFEAARVLCNRQRVSQGLFLPLALEIVIHIINDRFNDALNLYVILAYPHFAAEIFGNFESDLGRKGGRPKHIHKDEAIKIIKLVLNENPFENIDTLTANVFQELNKKYNDPPSLSTIKRWVRQSIRHKPLLN
nr:hypothetical protein [Providencia rettgeri]